MNLIFSPIYYISPIKSIIMPKKDPRVDAYIEKAQPFAKPILNHVRALVHDANPEVEETIKWSFASFDYKGPFFSMASFKNHIALGFWKASLMTDPHGYLKDRANQGGEAMGHFGRIEKMEDLPPDEVIRDFIRQAKQLNDDNVKLPKKPKEAPKELVVPDYFIAEIKKNDQADAIFSKWPTGKKKEYVDWITEAKTEKTRNDRMKTAVEWIAEGKIRNWKYVR